MSHREIVPTGSHPHKRLLALTSATGGFYIGFVKWRNQLLALFCLLLFLGFGVFYFRYWVIQKPFGIILFIGEGLDVEALAAARLHAGGPEKSLALDSLPYVTLLKNYSADSAIPDVAAAATAVATGTVVNNGAIALDTAGHPLRSLLALAQETGRMTGLITDGRLTAAMPASFYGHAPDVSHWQALAQQLVEEGEIDLVLGGGASDFAPAAEGGRRTDELNLTQTARTNGYEVVQTLSELENVPRWRRAKVLGLFAKDELAFRDQAAKEGDRTEPTLSEMVRRGIELLQFHRGGYLLVVDVSRMAEARREKEKDCWLEEIAELDRAVAIALNYTGNKSTIFVCGSATADMEGEASPIATASPVAPDAHEQNTESTAALEPGRELNRSESNAAQPVPNDDASPLLGPPPELFLPVAPPEPPPRPRDIIVLGEGLGSDALEGARESTSLFEIIRDNL